MSIVSTRGARVALYPHFVDWDVLGRVKCIATPLCYATRGLLINQPAWARFSPPFPSFSPVTQRSFHQFCWEFSDLLSLLQTQLVLDSHLTVTDTSTIIADMQLVLKLRHEGTSGQTQSVSVTSIHQHRNANHPLGSSKVSNIEYYGGLCIVLPFS